MYKVEIVIEGWFHKHSDAEGYVTQMRDKLSAASGTGVDHWSHTKPKIAESSVDCFKQCCCDMCEKRRDEQDDAEFDAFLKSDV